MLYISPTRIQLWRKCRRAHYYRYVMRIEPIEKSEALQIGTHYHNLIETQLTNKDTAPILQQAKEQGFDIELIWSEYVKQNQERHYIAVEESFEEPLTSKAKLVGKIDARYQVKDTQYIQETKTTKNMPSDLSSRYLEDVQAVVYYYVLREYEPLVVWDYILTVPPSIPKITKEGKVSKAKIMTTKEIFLNALNETNQSQEEYKELIDNLPTWTSWFKRYTLPLNASAVRSIMKEVLDTVSEIVRKPDSRDRNLQWTCKNCEFRTICHTELMGHDIEHLFRTKYRRK